MPVPREQAGGPGTERSVAVRYCAPSAGAGPIELRGRTQSRSIRDAEHLDPPPALRGLQAPHVRAHVCARETNRWNATSRERARVRLRSRSTWNAARDPSGPASAVRLPGPAARRHAAASHASGWPPSIPAILGAGLARTPNKAERPLVRPQGAPFLPISLFVCLGDELVELDHVVVLGEGWAALHARAGVDVCADGTIPCSGAIACAARPDGTRHCARPLPDPPPSPPARFAEAAVGEDPSQTPVPASGTWK